MKTQTGIFNMRRKFDMRRLFRSAGALLLASVLSCGFVGGAGAYGGVPETIRIGLYYASTAKESCTVTSTGGIAISVANENNSWPVTRDTSVSSVLVKRAAAYHAELPESYSDYESAWREKTALRNQGYPAFTAYRDGTFRVWVGAYPTKSEAEQTAAALGASVLVPHGKRVLVYAGDNIWMGVQDESSYLTLEPMDGNLAAEGTAYRGNIQFMRRDTGDMTVVNVVGFDDYLCGVVPREVTATWSYEAVKAQAVVSRTFAITNFNKYQKYGFNLDSTTNSQAYAGIKIEHPASNRAVQETHGEVVLYRGEPAKVYFFASSGGKTGTAKDAWGGGDEPYLVSVDDIYEDPNTATRARWEMRFTAQELKDKLAASGVHIGDITDVKVEYSDSGRAVRTVFCGTEGEKEYLRENVRWAVGVYSTAFTVSRSGGEPQAAVGNICALDGYNSFTQIAVGAETMLLSANGASGLSGALSILSADGTRTLEASSASGGTGDFIFTGCGWGHGVGMSQWGAKAMAEQGFGYRDILQFYFTGTEIG